MAARPDPTARSWRRPLLKCFVKGRRLARRVWRGSLAKFGRFKPLDATLGAKSLIGEITRLGAMLLVAGLGVSLIVSDIARRSSADDLADFDMIDFVEQEIAPALAFCRNAALSEQDSCFLEVSQRETRAIWRVEVGGDTFSSFTFDTSVALRQPGGCLAQNERRVGRLRFFTCWQGGEPALRVVERRGAPLLAAVEFAAWQDIADRADNRQVGGRGLRLAVGVMALAMVLVLALSLLATRRRLGRHFTRLDEALERYRQGEAASVEGAYPREIKALADSLNRAVARKTALMDRQRRYVAKMAHDLRHQLVAIDLAARPDAEGAVDQDDLAGELATLNGLVERYLTLTDWVGPTEGAPPAYVFEALDGARKAFSRRVRVDPLAFEVDCPEELRLRAHPADLRIILSNLVGNAHRFAASTIRLSARRVVKDAGFHESGDEEAVEIWVEDDGPGIPPEKRVDAVAWGGRLDAKRAGTGFGLSIVAEQLSELYDGALRLEESELGGLKAVGTLPGRTLR